MSVDDASRPPNASRPGSALNASRRPGSAPSNALRPGSALNAVRPSSALNASRPGSRASSRSSSRQFDPALFYSSTPTHHNLTSSTSSSNIARARRAENSRHGHVVLFMLGGPACGKTALSSALAAAIPGAPPRSHVPICTGHFTRRTLAAPVPQVWSTSRCSSYCGGKPSQAPSWASTSKRRLPSDRRLPRRCRPPCSATPWGPP